MARNVSDEELQLKKRARRRLVGAIVLVTAVAVVLPMVLDSEPKPVNQNINIQIPSPEAGVLSSAPTPLKPADTMAAAPKTEAAPKAEPAITAKSEAPVAAQAETKPEVKPEAKTEAKTEPKAEIKPQAQPEPKAAVKAEPKAATKDKPKAAAAGGFVVQVAALSDAARAKELQAQIAGGGLKAYTEVVQTAKGPVTRVRVGPYASREAAEKGRQQLQRLKLDGKVVPR